METSFKFSKIESHLLKLGALFLENKNIRKYLYYLDDNPLANEDIDTLDLQELGYFNFTSFDDTILTEDKIKVFLNPIRGLLGTLPTSDLYYGLDIIVPISKWELKGLGQLRAFRIMDEFSQLVDGQRITGIGEVAIVDFKSGKLGKTNYMYLSTGILVRSLAMKGLR